MYKPGGEEQRLVVLTREEMAVLLDSIDINQPGGMRDRCIFELMYSSGLRSSEVVKLNIGDIDFQYRMLLVREAKWGKDRVAPIGKVAMAFLKQYLYSRMGEQDQPVFVGRFGRMSGNTINRMLKVKAKAAGIYRPGLCAHSIRHTVAVHLLAGGADLRYVQELLGHESIETTVVYTHELYDNLKRIYCGFHPRENEYRKEIDDEYLEQLESFHDRLLKQKKKTMGCRESKKRWKEARNRKRKRS